MTTTPKRKASVLMVEDDAQVSDLIAAVLRLDGYGVEVAGDGATGLRSFFAHKPDLTILDVMLPQMDGWTLLERIREVSDAPVIMLTALATDNDKIRGLRSGADDYVAKPFSPQELLARVDAVLRRTPRAHQTPQQYRDEDVVIDFEHQRVYKDGETLHLSPTEYRLLSLLVRNLGSAVETEQLCEAVWGKGTATPEQLRVHIAALRKKIGPRPSGEARIHTVWGIGYRYEPRPAV